MCEPVTSQVTAHFNRPASTHRTPCSATDDRYSEDSFREDPIAGKEAGLTPWVCIDAPTVRLGG